MIATLGQRNPQVDAYLGGLVPERQMALAELRSLVFEVAPDAVETMRYRMPTYEHEGGVVCAFASQKHYMSLYLAPELVERHKQELAGLDIGKSCVRFRKLEKLPLDTVRAILQETMQGGGDVR